MPSYAFPPPPPTMEPTSPEEADRAVAHLRDHAQEWLDADLDSRISLLDELLSSVFDVAEEWANLSAQGKGLTGSDVGEEWITGPSVTLRNIRLLKHTLEEIRDHGGPRFPDSAISQRADGRVVVQVFPVDIFDKLMLGGITGEVWMDPSVTPSNLSQNVAEHYRNKPEEPAVALVLGAGNQTSIGPMDCLHKLFVERQVCVLKMNPVNEFLGPVLRRAFEPVVRRGYLEITYGGAAEGDYLCKHEGIDNIHITGSAKTHDIIVWGPGEGQEERKAKGDKANDKPISSELGCITPVIVVPGDWSEKDLRYQARSIVGMTTHNSSFNCAAAQLVVTPADWPLRERFMDLLREELRAAPTRKAYYPGARDRWQTFVDSHPKSEVLHEDHPDTVPWTLLPDLDPEETTHPCYCDEPFCGVLHEVPLPGSTAVDFLPGAVAFCNDNVWGTLSATVIIHPDNRKDPAEEAAFQEALDELEYGSIGVNAWSAGSYALVTTTWGAYPGHTLEDIGSGIGVVHNSFMFDKPVKSVFYSPFTTFPRPAWFHDHKRLHRIGAIVTSIEAQPSLLKVPGLVFNALLS